jgi:hypothetical protein
VRFKLISDASCNESCKYNKIRISAYSIKKLDAIIKTFFKFENTNKNIVYIQTRIKPIFDMDKIKSVISEYTPLGKYSIAILNNSHERLVSCAFVTNGILLSSHKFDNLVSTYQFLYNKLKLPKILSILSNNENLLFYLLPKEIIVFITTLL